MAPVYGVAEVARDPHFAARGAFAEARHPERGSFRQLAPVLAGAVPLAGPAALSAAGETDTDALLARRRLLRRRARGAAQRRSDRVTAPETPVAELPAEVRGWIGQKRYEEEGEFDVERGYVFTTCASVENGNPLFWDEKAAQELTGGWIAPPTHDLGLVPPALLGAGPDGGGPAAPGALRPEGEARRCPRR